jgi:Zn-dependent protease with chaperone function
LTTSGQGFFYDGLTSARHAVTVEAVADGLRVHGADGALLAEWPYGELQAMSAPDSVLRLGRANSPGLARLEIRDPALAAAIDDRTATVDRSGATERRNRKRVVFWTIAATVSLVLVAVFGLPALVVRLTPLIPMSVEQKFGDAVDGQVRSMLDTNKAGAAFECGLKDNEKAGRAALDKVMDRLQREASLPIRLKVAVVRRSDANAIALPGGHIYVFAGLINKANTPDEFAGVVAHEIGHVAHRDGTRSVLQAAGMSFLFGMLLGDFTGGGVLVIAARTVVQSAYSRDVEAEADRYGVELMTKTRADASALARILERIDGAVDPGITILLDHPQTKDRVAAINAMAAAARQPTEPLLSAQEWSALKRICR